MTFTWRTKFDFLVCIRYYYRNQDGPFLSQRWMRLTRFSGCLFHADSAYKQLDVAREALVSLPEIELYTLSRAPGAPDQCIWDFCTPGKELCDEAVDDNETALLCYSSGTSGAPKGVRSSHANLRATLALTVAASPESFTRQEVWTSVLPMSHMYGFVRPISVSSPPSTPRSSRP